ncbi:MAG: hypothetical protein HYX75_18625 [Acidobacteria bacterium]|nr:hypothetical protein [Acidobacteriota bacterium]
MKSGILVLAMLANLVAFLCVLHPWFENWAGHGIVFLILEAIFLTFIGVPVFVHHLRKGLPPRQALAASLDSVMNLLSGWV